jgi:chaperonin cofactor prefoldin
MVQITVLRRKLVSQLETLKSHSQLLNSQIKALQDESTSIETRIADRLGKRRR